MQDLKDETRRNFWRIMAEYCLNGMEKAIEATTVETKDLVLTNTKENAESMIKDFKNLLDKTKLT